MKKLILGIFLILLACQKEPEPDNPRCWECTYHESVWIFCNMTFVQIDSLQDVFGYDCPRDSLLCHEKDTTGLWDIKQFNQ
jgi:hypothetical protein